MIFKWLTKVCTHRFPALQLMRNGSNLLIFKNSGNKNMNSKPPNILVYTGTDTSVRFKEVEVNLGKCLKRDSYLVYHLLPSEVYKNPWIENCLLLVVSSDTIDNTILAAFETYLKNFGSVLLVSTKTNGPFFGSTCFQAASEDKLINFNFKNAGKVFLFRGKYSYISDGDVLCQDSDNKPLIQKITKNNNILIISEIYLDRDPELSQNLNEYNSDNRIAVLKYILTEELKLEGNTDNVLPELSPGYLFCKNELKLTNIFKSNEKSSGESIFHECKFRNLNAEVCKPIYFCQDKAFPAVNLNKNMYFSNLHTDIYGHYLVYFPVITSTMEAAEQLLEHEGIVVAAGCQISGKGRSSNKWISPKGCAMFTLHFTVTLNSNLGKKLTLLQHIASLAVVQGIKNQKKYKDLELKIKWPNDIYYNKTKVGGLIVSTVILRDLAHIYVGWGINVANKCPTTCINDVIDEYNFKNKCTIPHLHVEEVIAYTITQMEYYIKDFSESGPENFLANYYLNWMHNNQRVTLTSCNQQGIIVGLDEYGFLKIQLDKGETLVFQPDGNRFDIMKNLIHAI